MSLWRYQVTFESFRDNGTVPSGSSDAAFQVHAIGTGVRHELTPTLAVDAALGYSFTTSDAPQKDGHDGVIGNVKLTKTFHNGQASLGYVRRFTAGGSTGDVVIDDTVSAMASINLTGKLTARLESNVSWFNFQSVTTMHSHRRQLRPAFFVYTAQFDLSDPPSLGCLGGLYLRIHRLYG